MKVAHVSTFPETKCGIAFYASDLIAALPAMDHGLYALHYGENLTPDAIAHANANRLPELEALCRAITRSGSDVLSLQHEFGIWGGSNGEHLLTFLDGVSLPIVSTLHTTEISGPQRASQRILLRKLIQRSKVSVVLTESSRNSIYSACDVANDDVRVIPHGIPNIPFVPPPPPRRRSLEIMRARLFPTRQGT